MLSNVMLEKPAYADYDSPAKFQAIQGIIMTRLRQHPKASCSYSGGSDSDILLDLIESCRKIAPSLPEVTYHFFNTGLEMKAIKDHVKEQAEKYKVNIIECKPKVNIVMATKKYGLPFVSKVMSDGLYEVMSKNIPLNLGDLYDAAEDKEAFFRECCEKYPKCKSALTFLLCCDKNGEPRPNIQIVINSSKYLRDFIQINPPTFKISAKCCDYCKKAVAHKVEKDFELVITGERRDEGGQRSVPRKAGTNTCFTEMSSGNYRLRPLFYVSDKDKEWYRQTYNIKYSEAYTKYGLKRTGCCGCPISYRATEDLKQIEPYEPQLVKAAWNVFGDSYRYRAEYVEYKEKRKAEAKEQKKHG